MKPFIVTCLVMLIGLTFGQNEAPSGKGVSQIELIALLATGSTSERIAERVRGRGINFTVDEDFLKSLRDDGVGDTLLTTLKSAEVRRAEPPTKDPAKSRKDSEVLVHLHRAAQLNRNNFHPREAEPEFRAAVAADPTDPLTYQALGEILTRLGNDDAGIAEFRTALNLQPDLEDAHLQLGSLLLKNPAQHREGLDQLQQAVTLASSDPVAHSSYAYALDVNGDKQGAAEQRKIADGMRSSFVPNRIRVGGRVMQARLSSHPQPHYPKEAEDAGVEGQVQMNVLVGKDGSVKDIELIRGAPMLSDAAVNAVWKWRYKPTTLNGQPVEVETEVDVNFNLN